MNIQTERLENHSARLTVSVDADRLEKAKSVAARRLSKRFNIPGFRKGKAPYRIVANYLGEAAILEDAVDVLGNEIYREALSEADILPYTTGSLEDFTLEPEPTFIFTVPLQPTVNLQGYRSVRLDYTVPTTTDEEVDDQLKLLQEQQAVVEESHAPVKLGDRLTIDIHGVLVGEDSDSAEGETEAGIEAEAHAHAHDHDHDHEHGDHDHDLDEDSALPKVDRHSHSNSVIHQHDAMVILEEGREPVPGFGAALVGATVDEEREFVLTHPDEESYGELAGKDVKFYVTVKKIENITLPALNDDLAMRITAEEEKPLTLLELRMRVRENIQKDAEKKADGEYARRALDEMVSQAVVAYPEKLIEDQIDFMMEDFDQRMRQQGITLDDYIRISGKSKDDMRTDYVSPAKRVIERSLVLEEIKVVEDVEVSNERLTERIEEISAQFGEQADSFRQLFQSGQMRENLRNDLLNQAVMDRIAAIAKGTAPELGAGLAELSADAAEVTAPEETATSPAAPATATTSDEVSEQGETA